MSRKFIWILSFVFLVSAGFNVYLYNEAQRFEEAWVEQVVTTSEIEGILKESETDTSIENIRRLAIAKFGIDSVHSVEVPHIHIDWGSDREGLQVNRTLLLFNDGVYHGSKADLPLH